MRQKSAGSLFLLLARLLAGAAMLAVAACSPGKDQAYWREYEDGLRKFGALRTERDPAEITFTNAQFLRNRARSSVPRMSYQAQ